MIHDAWTVMWKEAKELIRIRGTRFGGMLGIVVFLSVFGIFLPIQMGREWVESPVVLVFWLWVPLFMVSSVVADSFAGERERHTLETLLASRLSDRSILIGKIGAAVGYGWGLTLMSLLLGCVSVNAAHAGYGFVFYRPIVWFGILLWSFLAAWLTACIGVLLSLKAATVRQAQQTLGITIMVLFFVPVFGFQALPANLKQSVTEIVASWSVTKVIYYVALLLLILTLALFRTTLVRFRRATLILD